jgi:hypothetical protein
VGKGNELYAAARARERGHTGDPLATRPDQLTRYAIVLALAEPCTCDAPGPPHSGLVHHLTDGGNRTYCTVTSATGRCPCKAYEPASNEVAKQEPATD